MNRLQAMKQDRESFVTFLPKFEKELGKSQLTMVPDMVKIGYLCGALITEIQRAMIGPVTYINYGGFVQALLAVGSQLDCLQYQKGRTAPITTPSCVWPDGDEMDWTPTIQKVKLCKCWTADEQQKCGQEGRCFNCLNCGHRANDCLGTKGEIPDKTKKESTASTTKVNAVKKKDVFRNSPTATPVIFVKKPGGGLRFCVDYRQLNEISRKDSYPIPRIDETLRIIAAAKYISKVDVISAFHRIRLKDGDEWKTAFNTRFGLYEWLVTPFGLIGAPTTFQRYINWVLHDKLNICCSAYIDDVVIYNDTQKEHRSAVLRIIRKLADAGLQLDFDKSEFEGGIIKYLRYLIKTGRGLRADLEKLEATQKWEPPIKVRGVRGFLGFCNYYRQFIDEYSRNAEPLTRLTRKDQPFHWTLECQHAFEQLKDTLIKAPLLAKWTPGLETAIECDSSGYAVGGTLMQKMKGLWHSVAYFSKKLNPAESNYPIHDKEMLAIIRCIREWRTQLVGQHFEVWSDHRNLAYFRKKQHLGKDKCVGPMN